MRQTAVSEPSQSGFTASNGQAPMQRPQPTHFSWSMCALPSIILIAFCAQFRAQRPQPMHLASSTEGLPSLCISILPPREPEPMPRFLIAPPKPVISWPLKCVSEIITSASAIARPIFASFIYSPPSTGTSASSVPFRPSAMTTWQPVQKGL